MKISKLVGKRVKETPAGATLNSHILLLRAGYIKQVGAGIFSLLPPAQKVSFKIQNIIRDEMNKLGGQEVLFPVVMPRELWDMSGRYSSIKNEMVRFKDRTGHDMLLGMTHEEASVHMMMNTATSPEDLPCMIYQIQTKFRDEARPRGGLIRVREFTMKDAYSFDADLESANASYKKMYDAYNNIFDRMDIDYRVVKADTGAMGGLLSEEYQAVTEIGEDTLVLCDSCDFSSNIEIAEVKTSNIKNEEEKKQMELIDTPNVHTIDELASFLNVSTDRCVKTLVCNIDGEIVFALVKGNKELNDTKLGKLFSATSVEMATEDDLKKVTDASFGSLGPVGVKAKIVIDNEVNNMSNFIVGANITDKHYINVNLDDFDIYKVADIVNIEEGNTCPKCGGKIYFKKGIEVGNLFNLGTKYSESLGLTYLNEENESVPVVMGSYGIGTARCMAAVVEQHNDDNGIIWPKEIAPYTVGIVLINPKDEIQNELAHNLYNMLWEQGIDTLLDDRNERPGVKFKDMDLIGLPIKITVGKRANENIVEFKTRDGKINKEIEIETILKEIREI